MAKRKAKHITNEKDISFLLNITEEQALKTSFIMEVFGEFKGKNRFNPYDTITIPINSYGSPDKKNKNAFTTTVGLWVFNKCFIERELFDIFKYVNETITNKKFNKMNSVLSYALLEDDIELEVLKRFLMKCQKYMPYVAILAPNRTLKMLVVTKEIDKKKEQLLKKYDKEIKAGDDKTAQLIEKELLEYARELLKDDPSLDIYDSGARGSWNNNFKNMYVMKGAIKDPDPTKGYNIATSSLADGIKKEEYAIFANSLAAGPYSRGKKTQTGGHYEKLFLSAFQHIKLDKPGSDCGTTKHIKYTITEDNIDDIMYSYIIEGNRLVELTSKNMSQYIGKTVKLRFSSKCETEKICNKCAGNLFYKLNMINIGTATPQIPSRLKNIAMKAFHDSSMRYSDMDVAKAFGF